MLTRIIAALIAVSSGAVGQVSFQTRYFPLDQQGVSVAIATDANGNIFIVSQTSHATPGIHATKLDSQGNFLASLDFGAGVLPTGAAVDPSGNLVTVGTWWADQP